MVTSSNNNKFYELSWDGKAPNFNVKYGRVESTAVTKSYPIGDWQKKYNEKVNKGYKDVTYTVSVKVDDTPVKTQTITQVGVPLVDNFLTLMKGYTDGLVSKTYSVKFTSVTQAQVDEAQSILDTLNTLASVKKVNDNKVNEKLIELYTIIPRYMSKVPEYLLPNINIRKSLDQEQINLDAIASQVKMYKKDPKKEKADKKQAQSLLDILGITMSEATDLREIDYLIKQLNKSGNKVKGYLQVNKPAEDEVFDGWLAAQKNKQTRILIHGTQNVSVIPILEIGLKIRPKGNFSFSGKVYGDGNYFSEVVQKSLGYTSYGQDRVLLVYEIHTGNPFKYDGWYKGNSFTLNYKELNSRGFDSTYVNPGGGLLNSEIITYKEEQCRIKYIIWLNN